MEAPKTVQIENGEMMPLFEYKKRLAIKIVPTGIILGAISATAFNSFEKGSWKYALMGMAIGGLLATFVLTNKFDKIDESYNK